MEEDTCVLNSAKPLISIPRRPLQGTIPYPAPHAKTHQDLPMRVGSGTCRSPVSRRKHLHESRYHYRALCWNSYLLFPRIGPPGIELANLSCLYFHLFLVIEHESSQSSFSPFSPSVSNVFTGEVGQPLEVGHVATTNHTQIEVPRALISTHNQLKKQSIKGFRETSV